MSGLPYYYSNHSLPQEYCSSILGHPYFKHFALLCRWDVYFYFKHLSHFSSHETVMLAMVLLRLFLVSGQGSSYGLKFLFYCLPQAVLLLLPIQDEELNYTTLCKVSSSTPRKIIMDNTPELTNNTLSVLGFIFLLWQYLQKWISEEILDSCEFPTYLLSIIHPLLWLAYQLHMYVVLKWIPHRKYRR